MDSAETPGAPQEFLTVCGSVGAAQPLALPASFEVSRQMVPQKIEHMRNRDKRRGPFAFYSPYHIARLRRRLEDDTRPKQRRHENRHELPEDVAQWHKRNKPQRMEPALVFAVRLDALLERF